MKNFLSILFLAVFTLTASAQGGRVTVRPGGMGGVGGSIGDQSKGYIMGSVVLSPDTPDGEEIPGAGVMVLVKFNSKATGKADSLYTVVGEKGYFFVRDIPVGKAYVSFDMLGYKREAKTIDINP
ncbi:MAG: carboxypeptidase-like regulatory domain-containing protein, partial [Bacteroidales bacterium]|nr:carboxypeptidase-like regulatory domain-containing protein [Bacteroidales bacterium]